MSKFNDVFNLGSITINVASQCNLNCAYCFEHDKFKGKMRPEDAVKIFDTAFKNYKACHQDGGEFVVAFFGGEPFLNFEAIQAVLEYADKIGVADECSFGVTTNLTLMTDEHLDIIEKHELHIMVSVDGVKAVHDKNRCGSYDVVEKNIKKLVDRGLAYLIEARMTLMPQDIDTMYDGVVNLINLGIDNIDPMFVCDTDWDYDSFRTLMRETERLVNLVIDIANNEDNKRNIVLAPIEEKLVYCFDYDNDMSQPCAAGSTRFVSVAPNGDLMPCHQQHYNEKHKKYTIGNILTDDIDETKILGGVKNMTWYSEVEKYDCAQCEAKNLCRGWCPSENITERDDRLQVPAIICFYNKALIGLLMAYQDKILNSTNLRGRKLNLLKYSLAFMKELKEVLAMDVNSKEFIARLMDLNTRCIIEKDLLLPPFVSAAQKKIDEFLKVLQEEVEHGKE